MGKYGEIYGEYGEIWGIYGEKNVGKYGKIGITRYPKLTVLPLNSLNYKCGHDY